MMFSNEYWNHLWEGFVGSLAFELLRSAAVTLMPGTWQMILGAALLLTILFLPEGLGSIFARLRRSTEKPP